MINIVRLSEQEYSILQDEHELGVIQIYSNSFHNQNCYLKLNLQNYDLQIASELFSELMRIIQRPLQMLLASGETEKITFIEMAGFVCKRKCYELEVQRKDYVGDSISNKALRWCEKDTVEYEKSCELLYAYYTQTHEVISPLTVDVQTFSKELPTKVLYEQVEDEVIHAAFIEENEIAYVCTKDKDRFLSFLNGMVEELFTKNESLIFECDDCDWAAMELRSLFNVEISASYNTYIRNMKLLDIQPSQFYISKEKISKIKEWFHPFDLSNFEPIPIKKLNGKIIFTDGHTRAWMAYEAGLTEVPVVWDEDDLDWELYQKCVDACLECEIRTIANLKGRVLSSEDYVIKWDNWCDELQEKHAYIKNPCGTYSIPYWKNKSIQIPKNMKIIHDRDFEDRMLLEYNDEKYFRLKHDLKDVEKANSEEFYIETVSIEDIPLVQELINLSYENLSVTQEQLLEYTKLEVYDEDLWIIVYETSTDKPVACGIAELDKELKEGVLEWIQVLPDYRGKKIGQLIVNELLMRLQEKSDFVTVSGKVDNDTKPEFLYRKCGFTGEDIWHILTKKRKNR
ncbi:MAG: GNAT family N-acetyltransferase [Agathobacter sp.]|nr:GNAT family N-acetyltransferase [Agathobacter sp.]